MLTKALKTTWRYKGILGIGQPILPKFGVKAMDYQREETAYHEAGHFVAAVLILFKPGRISIEPDGESLGIVSRLEDYGMSVMMAVEYLGIDPQKRDTTTDELLWEGAVKSADTNAFLCAAGGVAAQMYLDTLDTEQLLKATGTWEDDWDAVDVYDWLDFHDDPYERYDEIKRWTKQIFTDETVWAAIDYVARSLLEKGSFDEDASGDLLVETRKLLKGKTAPPHFENLQKRYPISADETTETWNTVTVDSQR